MALLLCLFLLSPGLLQLPLQPLHLSLQLLLKLPHLTLNKHIKMPSNLAGCGSTVDKWQCIRACS